jgi:hypothetical protein
VGGRNNFDIIKVGAKRTTETNIVSSLAAKSSICFRHGPPKL